MRRDERIRPAGETQCSYQLYVYNIYYRILYGDRTWPFRRMSMRLQILHVYIVISSTTWCVCVYISRDRARVRGMHLARKKCVRRLKNPNKSGKGVAVILIKFSGNVAKKHRLLYRTHTRLCTIKIYTYIIYYAYHYENIRVIPTMGGVLLQGAWVW